MTVARRIEDYAVVTLITVLIWFYAESRMLDTYSDPAAPVALEVTIPADNRVVVRHSPERISNFEFVGSRTSISALKREMGGRIQLQLDNLDQGTHSLPLAKLMAEQYSHLNVSVGPITPPTLEVTVAELRIEQAKLIWNPQEITLEDQPEITPATVKITLPSDRTSDVAGSDGTITLPVRPTVDLQRLEANVHHTRIPATVELPDALLGNRHVTVDPRNVELSFTIEDREARHTLPSVPVFVSAPPAVWANFRVEPHEEDRLINNVTVAGPPDLVERVRSGDITVLAQPVLDRDDLVRGATSESVVAAVMFITRPHTPRLTIESPKTSVRLSVRRLNE